MENTALNATLAQFGVMVKNSHVVYTSGKHGSAYFNKDALYPHTETTKMLCGQLAARFAHMRPEIVIAPAVGGIALTQWTAHALTHLLGYQALAIYADKDDEHKGEFVIKRGYDKLVRDKRVIVLEDVLTTGGSTKKVIETVRTHKGYVVGVGALCNRGNITAQKLDVSFLTALWDITLDAWEAHECPLCRDGVPINTDVGKGKEFLAGQRK